jgi:hypothetical protein
MPDDIILGMQCKLEEKRKENAKKNYS